MSCSINPPCGNVVTCGRCRLAAKNAAFLDSLVPFQGGPRVLPRTQMNVAQYKVHPPPPPPLPVPTEIQAPSPTARPSGGCGGCGSKARAVTRELRRGVTFDRAVLINLKRRPDRLEAFRAAQIKNGWHLPQVEVVPAVDGRRCPRPASYRAGAGAFGCMRSHVQVLEKALTDGVESLLVLEDDATWEPDWAPLAAFFRAVPPDWDQLMLGGQHRVPATQVAPGVVRCRNTHRTHAYAVRGQGIRDLLSLWYGCDTHIDHVMGPWQAQGDRKVYAPERFFFGQAAGRSDISGRNNPAKLWSTPKTNTLLFHVTAPPEAVAEVVAANLLHVGYTKDPETGLDAGLEAASRMEPQARAEAIRKWVRIIVEESAGVPGRVPGLWHPRLSVAEVQTAAPGYRVVPVRAVTAADLTAVIASGKARP